jgi:hypothetical protein
MCVTDPCRDNILYENGEWKTEPSSVEEMIEKYNKSRTRFLYYAWGIWVTAYARRNLFTGIVEFKDEVFPSVKSNETFLTSALYKHFLGRKTA